MGEVRSEVERQAKKDSEIPAPERVQSEERAEAFLDQLMSPPPNAQAQQTENPTEARVAKSRQSGPTSETREGIARGTTDSRPSVRQELKTIREERSQTANHSPKDKIKVQTASPQHHDPSISKGKPKSKNHKER